MSDMQQVVSRFGFGGLRLQSDVQIANVNCVVYCTISHSERVLCITPHGLTGLSTSITFP